MSFKIINNSTAGQPIHAMTTSLPPNTSSSVTSTTRRSVTTKRCGLMLCQKEPGYFMLSTTACTGESKHKIKLHNQTTVYIETNSSVLQSDIQCKWSMEGPTQHYVNMTIDQLSTKYENSDSNYGLIFSSEQEGRRVLNDSILQNGRASLVVSSVFNVEFMSHAPHRLLAITIQFVLTKGAIMHALPVTRMTNSVRYVTSPRFDGSRNMYLRNYEGVFYLNLADNKSVLVSFIHFSLEEGKQCQFDVVTFTVLRQNQRWRKCGTQNIPLQVYRFPIKLHFHSDELVERTGFKMMFAILTRSREPQQISVDLLNCSVSYFHVFQPMLSCNMMRECQGAEDEEDCSYYSEDCEDRDIDAGDKCYKLFRGENVTWTGANLECVKINRKLAMLTTAHELKKFQEIVSLMRNSHLLYIGAHLLSRQLTEFVVISAIYRDVWQWMDGRSAFAIYVSGLYFTCAVYKPVRYSLIFPFKCHEGRAAGFFCEYEKANNTKVNQNITNNIYFNVSKSSTDLIWNVSMVQCDSFHVTREFIPCASQPVCSGSDSTMLCKMSDTQIPKFMCQNSNAALHFTIVCDFVRHCIDGSDEDFCYHTPCLFTERQCRNGQCISRDRFCDGKIHCYDGTDELRCFLSTDIYVTSSFSTGLYNTGVNGRLMREKMKGIVECPTTHFQCPHGHCLPVYLRCNGIDDCPGREDEAECDSYVCPGLYRCQATKICLFPVHVCDGVFHCPQFDDELLCEETCPDTCYCQGLAFICTSNFSVIRYTEVRYLDVSSTGMNPIDLTDNLYLIYLCMSRCHISFLPSLKLPNLIYIDLSWNQIEFINVQQFQQLKNLRVLVLSGNPLTMITDEGPTEAKTVKLWTLDISRSDIGVFNGSALTRLSSLKMLNISASRLTTITREGFQFTPMLETLDFRGSPLQTFPKDLLRHLVTLKVVQTDNYILCCKVLLPIDFDLKNCHAKQDLLASCEDLLKAKTYRVFLWVLSSLTLLGNLGSFVGRLYLHTDSGQSSFSVFVTCLSVSDFIMGVYLAMIGVADVVYHGEYLWHHDQWKNSVTCSIAGLLSVTSSEVSSFLICLITLDRFLVLCFPFRSVHFSKRSAAIACGIVWMVGSLLAIIPLLPATSSWKFYSQSAMCIPFPFMNKDTFLGYTYSFSIMIILNSILFLLIAVGQVTVYLSVRSNSMSSGKTTASRDVTIARRLTSIVVSDFLCWFPIGLLGVLASTGTAVPDELNVAVAIFVLPFNSALNPFLYTVNVLLEKHRKHQEACLLKQLESRMHGLYPFSDKSHNGMVSIDKIIAG